MHITFGCITPAWKWSAHMNVLKVIVITITAAIVLPQTIAIGQFGMNVFHDGHQKSVPIQTCNNTLPCFSAHQASVPPAVNALERLLLVLMMIGVVAIYSLVKDREQWVECHRQRIRQYIHNCTGIHMHAFDTMRYWIASGMMVQKVTNTIV